MNQINNGSHIKACAKVPKLVPLSTGIDSQAPGNCKKYHLYLFIFFLKLEESEYANSSFQSKSGAKL